MIVWFGQRMYGKVDSVPGLCHVATRFFHVQFVPLVPLQSFIILAGTGDEQGVPTSMSFRSVLFAWVRAALIAGIVGALVMAVIGGMEYSAHGRLGAELFAGGVGGFAISGGLYWASLRFTRAGFDRAIELAEQLGVPREIIEQQFTQTIEPAAEASNWYDTVSGGQGS